MRLIQMHNVRAKHLMENLYWHEYMLEKEDL